MLIYEYHKEKALALLNANKEISLYVIAEKAECMSTYRRQLQGNL
jgi:hypothetical protein